MLPKGYPGMSQIPDDLFWLMGCGNFQQFCSTFRGLIDPNHHCPFCNISLQKRPLLTWTPDRRWYVKPNDVRSKGNELIMYLIVPAWHMTDPDDLVPHEGTNILWLFQWLWDYDTKVVGGALVGRFGPAKRSSGTIEHFHMNVVTPDGLIKREETISKTPEKRAENYARLLEHRAELNQRGGIEWLFSAE